MARAWSVASGSESPRVGKERVDQGSSEVHKRDNDQIEWNRHAGNIHKICGARIKQREASSPVLPSERMSGQRRVAGTSQKFFDFTQGRKIAQQRFLLDKERQSVTICLKQAAYAGDGRKKSIVIRPTDQVFERRGRNEPLPDTPDGSTKSPSVGELSDNAL
jgi:hypothetical protein